MRKPSRERGQHNAHAFLFYFKYISRRVIATSAAAVLHPAPAELSQGGRRDGRRRSTWQVASRFVPDQRRCPIAVVYHASLSVHSSQRNRFVPVYAVHA
jgi:hypothetical protein